MLKKYIKSALVLALGAMVCGLASPSNAAITISIADVTVTPGSVALLAVYAMSNNNDVMSGFNLPFDINNDGFVDANHDLVGDLPAGFTLGIVPIQNLLYANTGLDMPQPQITLIHVDAIATGSGANVQLSSTPVKLFDVVVKVDSSVPVGTVLPFRIVIPQTPFEPLFNVAGPDNPTVIAPTQGFPIFGSITVVPEPSSMVVVMFASAALLRRSRRGGTRGR